MFEVLPFNIRVDYLPRRVDIAALKAGNFAELVNLVQWKVDISTYIVFVPAFVETVINKFFL